jgi:hypothetical protein
VDSAAIAAVVGSVVVGLLVRVSNMLVKWVARVLKVEEPEPIPEPGKERE